MCVLVWVSGIRTRHYGGISPWMSRDQVDPVVEFPEAHRWLVQIRSGVQSRLRAVIKRTDVFRSLISGGCGLSNTRFENSSSRGILHCLNTGPYTGCKSLVLRQQRDVFKVGQDWVTSISNRLNKPSPLVALSRGKPQIVDHCFSTGGPSTYYSTLLFGEKVQFEQGFGVTVKSQN